MCLQFKVDGFEPCYYASSTIVSKVVEGHKFRAVDIGECDVGCSDGGTH